MAYLDSDNVDELVADIKALADNTYATPSSTWDSTKINDATYSKNQKQLNDAFNYKVMYYNDVAVSTGTSEQIMRIPASGTNEWITVHTVVAECVFDDLYSIKSDIEWTSYNGYIVFTGTCNAATTANVVLVSKGNLIT